MDQSTLFAEEPLAKASVTLDCAKAWMTLVATSCLPLVPSLQNIAPSGWFSKTSPASCRVGPDETLQAFWASSRASASSRRKTDGSQAASSPELTTPMALRGECLTLSLPEYTASLVPSPNDGTVCSLSDVLETGEVPQRYFLSAKACAGILRRAAVRGCVLPPHLLAALKAVAEADTPDADKKMTSTSLPEPSPGMAPVLAGESVPTKRRRIKSSATA